MKGGLSAWQGISGDGGGGEGAERERVEGVGGAGWRAAHKNSSAKTPGMAMSFR